MNKGKVRVIGYLHGYMQKQANPAWDVTGPNGAITTDNTPAAIPEPTINQAKAKASVGIPEPTIDQPAAKKSVFMNQVRQAGAPLVGGAVSNYYKQRELAKPKQPSKPATTAELLGGLGSNAAYRQNPLSKQPLPSHEDAHSQQYNGGEDVMKSAWDKFKTKLKPSPMSKEGAEMLPGQGMGPGMQASTNGFPLNPEMAAAQTDAGGADQQAAMEQQQQAQQRQQELDELKKMEEETQFQAEKQKTTGNIFKNQMKMKQEAEKIQEAQTNVQNEEALSTMINTSSPGEGAV